MNSLYLILEALSSKKEEDLLIHTKEELVDMINDSNQMHDTLNKDYQVNIFSRYIPKDYNELKELFKESSYGYEVYIITLAGDVMQIQNLKDNYNNILSNLDSIEYITRKQVEDDLDNYRDKGNELIHLDPKDNMIDCIRGSVIKSTYYSICEEILSDKSESLQEEITKTIEEEVDEDVKKVKNELDMVNIVVEKYLKGDLNNLEITECTYNGLSINPADLIYKLHSHTMPDYLEQIDIRTTLNDTYTIKTNLGDIYREPGTGRIYALSKNDDEVK